MAEPARFSSPRPRPVAAPFELPRPPTTAELLAERMRELPVLDSRAALLALTARDLPTPDGVPPPDMAEQERSITYTLIALRGALSDHPGVYVGGYDLVYDAGGPEEPDRTTPGWVWPDVLVAFGVGSHVRPSYVVWQEGKPPDFVLEVASASTWRRDRDEKPSIYESLGVREYMLYDPVGGRLKPRLQGHVLRGGAYRAMEPERLPNGERGLRSEVLGLCVYLRGPEEAIRWHDPATGRDLEDHEEVLAARRAAEAEVAALRARLRQLGGEPAT